MNGWRVMSQVKSRVKSGVGEMDDGESFFGEKVKSSQATN